MPLPMIDLVYGLLLPAVVAAAVALAVARGTPRAGVSAFGVAVALASGFLVGYVLLGLAPLQPATHWHWLPWTVVLGLGGALVGTTSGRRSHLLAWLVYVVVAAVAGWLLVPTWPDLVPSRGVQWATWTAYVVAVAGALMTTLNRQRTAVGSSSTAVDGLPTVWVALVLAGTLLATAGVLVVSGSMRFAQMAGCGAGAALGIAGAAAIAPQRIDLTRLPLPVTVLTAGAMWIGRVNSYSDVPLVSYVLVPLAPLALGLSRARLLQRSPQGVRTAATVGAAVTVGVAAILIAVIAEWPLL